MEETSHILNLWSRITLSLELKGYKGGGNLFSITLEEHLRDDYGWQAIAHCVKGPSLDELEDKSVKGWGLEAHEALLDLLANVEKMEPLNAEEGKG